MHGNTSAGAENLGAYCNALVWFAFINVPIFRINFPLAQMLSSNGLRMCCKWDYAHVQDARKKPKRSSFDLEKPNFMTWFFQLALYQNIRCPIKTPTYHGERPLLSNYQPAHCTGYPFSIDHQWTWLTAQNKHFDTLRVLWYRRLLTEFWYLIIQSDAFSNDIRCRLVH